MDSSFVGVPPSQTLYVSNLNHKTSKEVTRKSLYALFTQFGRIMDVVVSRAAVSRGQAWVVFDDIGSATNALRQLQGFNFFDRPMRVAFAKGKSHAVAQADGTYHLVLKGKAETAEGSISVAEAAVAVLAAAAQTAAEYEGQLRERDEQLHTRNEELREKQAELRARDEQLLEQRDALIELGDELAWYREELQLLREEYRTELQAMRDEYDLLARESRNAGNALALWGVQGSNADLRKQLAAANAKVQQLLHEQDEEQRAERAAERATQHESGVVRQASTSHASVTHVQHR